MVRALKSSASLAKAAQQSCCKQTWVHSAGSLLADHADNNIRKKNGSLSCDCRSSGVLPVCISLVASPLDFLSFLTEVSALMLWCLFSVWYLSDACRAIFMYHLDSFISKLLPFTGAEQVSDSEHL